MDALILLVGDSHFRTSVLNLISDLAAFTVEVADSSSTAIPILQAQHPDVMVVQASQPKSLELCQQVKTQNRLAWIYCILVEDQPLLRFAEPGSEVAARIEALEIGADAFLGLSLNVAANVEASPGDRLAKRWLRVQVRVGLRQAQNHRELMRTNDVLSTIALSDSLTELSNRRAFEWELPRQIQNARTQELPVSLIMLDIDYFKSINDTYGHLVGDRTLQLFAARLRHNLRFYDTPFRYGGEEFVVILSDTDYPETIAIANRLCQLVGEQSFAINDELELTVTVSAGIATLQPNDDPKGISLLRRADECLLQAKVQGRNRVIGLL
jgi:two-component system, cell cycle response regulator